MLGATVSHHLEYKTENDVPSGLKRDFYALSGLFYLADTHFEMFAKASQESRRRAEALASVTNFDLDQEINLDSLQLYLRYKFPERSHGDRRDISVLMTELVRGGYARATLRQLDDLVDRAAPALAAFEAEPTTLAKFMDIGAMRSSLAFLDSKFAGNNPAIGKLPDKFLKLAGSG
jgi:putative GTP pyrophosphokinase